jgi:hypothetical protein
MVNMPEKFDWSSYKYYIGKSKKLDWLMVDFILCYFDKDNLQARKKYQEFVNAGVNIKSESPLEKTVASSLLGSDDFIALIKDKYFDFKDNDRNVPAVKELKMSPDMAETHKKITAVCNGDASQSKKMTLYLFHKYSDKRLREIGEFFGIGESAVSDASRRFDVILRSNRKLRKEIELLRDQLKF